MPEIAKDVMVALLSAAVGFAGLLLIFSGFLFAQAASFPPSIDDEIIDRYRNAGRWGLAPFLIALTVSALAFAWMITPCAAIYWATIWSFGILIATSGIYGSLMLIKYL